MTKDRKLRDSVAEIMLSPMCETILDIKLCDNNQNIITFYLFYSTPILPKCYPPYTLYLHMADNRLYFIWWVANKTSAQSSAVSSGCRGGTWALTPHPLPPPPVPSFPLAHGVFLQL